jgi:hypothetical protein
VRADRHVELPVGERPRLAVAQVALDPRVGGEPLGGGIAVVAVEPTGRVGLEVEDPVRAGKRLRPAAHVEDERVAGQALHAREALGDHRAPSSR